jgi:predicted RNA-binding protein YlqC (UPF0109 family)
MKNALQFIVASIVDNADAVVVDESQENGTTNFVIHVAKEDVGKVIGKEGKVIRAIRNVMKIPAIKQNLRIYITVAES